MQTYYAEIHMFSIAVLLVLGMKSRMFWIDKRTDRRRFVIALWLALAAEFFDMLLSIGMANTDVTPREFLYLCAFLNFVLLSFVSFYIFLHSEKILKSRIFKSKKLFAIAVTPFAINLVLLILSLFCGATFYFDDALVYHRGSLFFVQQALVYGYIVAVAVSNMISFVKRNDYAHLEEIKSNAFFVLVALAFGSVQLFMPCVPFASLGITTAFLLCYTASLESMILVDQMTGLGNRREMFIRLDEAIRSKKKNEKLYFLFIDIDNFKHINDFYGHSEGDNVIFLVARALRHICNANGAVCMRYGGDEFAVIQPLSPNADIADIRKSIYEKIERAQRKYDFEFGLSVSVGTAEYGKDAASVYELVNKADKDMYEKKEKRKAAKVE